MKKNTDQHDSTENQVSVSTMHLQKENLELQKENLELKTRIVELEKKVFELEQKPDLYRGGIIRPRPER